MQIRNKGGLIKMQKTLMPIDMETEVKNLYGFLEVITWEMDGKKEIMGIGLKQDITYKELHTYGYIREDLTYKGLVRILDYFMDNKKEFADAMNKLYGSKIY